MANRKEDEKNERIIRNLLKLPDNRRCINCNSLGPQYVCTNFWTFICTTCSGIHREFTHRVKSVSMAKFTSLEVSALQGGGNASAKEIYLKEWDSQRNSLPDGSNVEKLRNFIKHVYVDKRFTGERSFDKPPRGKMSEAEDNENRKADSYRGASRSPPYEEVYERRFSDRSSPGGRSPGGRSPGYDQRSPARAEVVNDWRREDRFGNGRKSDDSRISDGGSKFDSKSPDHQSDVESSSPPLVRPVRDILGENVSPLRVIEPPKSSVGRSADGSLRTQRNASSSSLASSNENPVELKTETSLIDFDAVPEAPAAPQTQQTATVLPAEQPTISGSDNWANFDVLSEVKSSTAPSITNPLDSLFELAAPTTLPGHTPAVSGGNAPPAATPFDGFSPVATPSSASVAGGSGTTFANTSGGHWPSVQPQQDSLFPISGAQPIPQLSAPTAGLPSGNQPWNASVAPNTTLGFPGGAVSHVSQSVTKSVLQEPAFGRKELPEDLFNVGYSSMPGVFPGWHVGSQHGYGFGMQYNMPMPTSTLLQPSNSTNPFDVVNEPSSLQTPAFPSMTSLQGALPNMAAPSGLHTSSLGNPTTHLTLPQQAPSYASTVPPSSYMGHHVASSMPQRPQGSGGFGFDGAAFSSNQQLGALYSAPATQNTSSGGNPFG